MTTLLMLKGLPASGKSTYARELVDKGYVRVNKDDIRSMLHNRKFSKDNEKQVIVIRDQIIKDSLSRGKNIVVDDTNFAEKHQNRLKELAKKYDATFKVKFIDTPLEVCINRDLIRINSVGSKVITDMYNQFIKPLPEVYLPPLGMPTAIICDIDGTLAHMVDRSPYDYSKVHTDTVDEDVRDIVIRYHRDAYEIILVSGRPDSCRDETIKWLKDNSIPFDDLYMRKEGDKRPDTIIKKEIFDNEIKDGYKVKFVLDDRNRVVKMWREQGLKCLQVAEGDF